MDGKVIIWPKRAELFYDEVLLYYSSNKKRSIYGRKLHKKVTELTYPPFGISRAWKNC